MINNVRAELTAANINVDILRKTTQIKFDNVIQNITY
jgi:hypothetical protein